MLNIGGSKNSFSSGGAWGRQGGSAMNLFRCFFSLLVVFSTTASLGQETTSLHIVLPKNPPLTTFKAAEELSGDIKEFSLLRLGAEGTRVYLGEVDHLEPLLMASLDPDSYSQWQRQSLGSDDEAFTVSVVLGRDGREAFIISGGGPRGTFYGVYHFAEFFLKVLPGQYWLVPEGRGRLVESLPLKPYFYREEAPVIPLRGYFDNDNDMLANWYRQDLGAGNRKLVIERATWRDMIDTLARLRYNFIDLHDTLGRPEFFAWDFYQKKFPGYEADPQLIRDVIDYAHQKAMLVQVPLYLGWEFLRKKDGAPWRPGRLSEQDLCYSKSKERWHEILDYMLNDEHSPVKDGDIFLQRPRHPYFDYPYTPCAGEAVGPLMTEWTNHMYQEVKKTNPEAQLVMDLWHEGQGLWQSGAFRPDKNIVMIWADAINADIGTLPTELHGYDFGLYLHAGVWLNHVVQDPIPERLGVAVKKGMDAGMNRYLFVNGQDFRHFLLSLEAAGRAARQPYEFDGAAFQREWASRYFGALADSADQSLRFLRLAHDNGGAYGVYYGGYRLITERINQLLRGGHLGEPRLDSKWLQNSRQALALAQKAFESGRGTDSERLAFYDQIVFPAEIYHRNMVLLHQVTKLRLASGASQAEVETLRARVVEAARQHYESLQKGSHWQKWAGWTDPENFRVFTPPIDPVDVERMVGDLPR